MAEQRQPLVGKKELTAEGIKAGMQQLPGAGDVDLGVFYTLVIAMNDNRRRGQQRQPKERRAPCGGCCAWACTNRRFTGAASWVRIQETSQKLFSRRRAAGNHRRTVALFSGCRIASYQYMPRRLCGRAHRRLSRRRFCVRARPREGFDAFQE